MAKRYHKVTMVLFQPEPNNWNAIRFIQKEIICVLINSYLAELFVFVWSLSWIPRSPLKSRPAPMFPSEQSTTFMILAGCAKKRNSHSCLILTCKEICIGNLASFLLEDFLTIELLNEHILIGFTKSNRETKLKRVF